MAQHDQDLANASGSAFRADLNNALAALFTNSSGATEPSVTTAYMWWADTTANQLKLRNSDNDGWVVIQELDGTMLMEDGSAASPSLSFASDTDTGLYKDGDNRIGIATGGVERATILDAGFIFNDAGNDLNFRVESNNNANMLFIDGGTDRIGVGLNAPTGALDIAVGGAGPARVIASQDSDNPHLDFYRTTGSGSNFGGVRISTPSTSGEIAFSSATSAEIGSHSFSEHVRIDSSGRLAVGITNPSCVTGGIHAVHDNTEGSPSFVGNEVGIFQRNFNSAQGSAIGIISGTASNSDINLGDKDSANIGKIRYNNSDNFMSFATDSTERMRLFSTGQTHHFSTQGVMFAGTSQGAGTTYWLFRGNRNRTSNTAGGVTVYYVWSNGNVQNTNNSYTGISDVKLKENIVDATSQWDDLKALQVRKYNFIEGETHTQIGLIAQEVETVSPGLVNEIADRDAEGNDLGTVTKSVNYSVLYMKAVKALQEAMERIETLETKVAALEAG